MFASPMITCRRRYFSGTACGSSLVLMIGRFSVVSRPTSTSKKSERWLIWKPSSPPAGPRPTPPAPADHLPGHEERGEVPHDVGKRRRAAHQVVLVAAVRCALIVGVVLVQLNRGTAGHLPGPGRGLRHDPLARFIPDDGVERVRALGRRVLGVGMVYVQPGAVGEDHVGEAQVLVGQLRRVGRVPGQVEPPGVAQRVLFLKIPPGPPRTRRPRGLVGVDDLRGGHHRVRARLTGYGDPVLGLRTYDPTHAHDSEPSADIPPSCPCVTVPAHSWLQFPPPATGTDRCWPPCRWTGPPRYRAYRTPGS